KNSNTDDETMTHRCFNDQPSIFLYLTSSQSWNASNLFEIPRKKLAMGFKDFHQLIGFPFPNFAASIGVSVKLTKSERSVEMTTVRPNSRRIFPASPETSEIGKKTTTSTSVIAIAAKPISFLPLIAAFT